MKSLLRATFHFSLCSAMLVSGMAGAECKLQVLTPKGSEVLAENRVINLGEADDPVTPTAWQGPVVAGACTFDLSIVEQPLVLAGGRYLYVSSYSGNVRHLTLVDLGACSARWKSAPFVGNSTITSRQLVLGGQRIPLDTHCFPQPKRSPGRISGHPGEKSF